MTNLEATIKRLDEQISWYDSNSTKCQKCFKVLKFIEMAAAAVIPFSAGFRLSPFITGSLGILIVILEGLQQTSQFHHNWIIYRSTCEELKHEKYLYNAVAGPYATVENPNMLLAERIEGLISQEHAKWISARQESPKIKKQGGSCVS